MESIEISYPQISVIGRPLRQKASFPAYLCGLNVISWFASFSFQGKKKRSKDRDSFRSGGTWPRTRGGPIIEHGTGTILHPQKQKKERLPLAELLSNLPKYPPEGRVFEIQVRY